MSSTLLPMLRLLGLLTLLTGVAYPALTTGLSYLFFPFQANGSLLVHKGRILGSHWIGQHNEDPRFFWGRPSATSPIPYKADASGASNWGPRHPELAKRIKARIDALQKADPNAPFPIPVDLVTASASGLDPHISKATALYQAPRIAHLRGLPLERVNALIQKHTEGRQWGIFGEIRVHVLSLNQSLEAR